MNDPRPIALIGYRGTGKTTVAQFLARSLSWDWIDADMEVELRAGKSIATIFSNDGEDAFRDLEAQVVTELCQRERMILALGGGAILRESSRRTLSQCQAVAWLRASPETLNLRIAQDSSTAARRPNLTNHDGRTEIELLLAQREPFYRGCATLEVDTENREPAEIADEIIAALSADG
jgi:shikimate kinase